jgi:phosphoribosylanthranilate isomerase
MLKAKVKISKVNNLTEARYFAAMGADYLGFCCNPGTERFCAPTKIKEIISWVEGPQFVMEFDGWQSEDEIRQLLSLDKVQAVHFGAFATYKVDFGVPVFKDFILENLNEEDFNDVDFPVIRSEKQFHQMTEEEIAMLRHYLSIKMTHIDIDLTKEDLQMMLETLPYFGIILRGGDEEKTGVKSFEELDELFEILED